MYNLGLIESEREITPRDSRKSFYGKAREIRTTTGARMLKSYNTIVLVILSDGRAVNTWSDWTATTGRHIASFCGMNKAEYSKLERGNVLEDDERGSLTLEIIAED